MKGEIVMVSLNEAINIAKQNNKGLVIEEVMESEKEYIFPVMTPNGIDGSTFYCKVDKESGDYGTFDFWKEILTNPDFNKTEETIKRIG